MPLTCFVCDRYSLACSSDQKKTVFLQKASIIVRSVKLSHSTSGIKTNGADSASRMEKCMSLSTEMCMANSQCLHCVSTSTAIYSLHNRPCTKGAAMASSAQAPYKRSPVLKCNRCGVGSTVTGYAQVTAPCASRARKKSRLSNSSKTTFTCS